MLKFVSEYVSNSYDVYEGILDNYNSDAEYIDTLVNDFSTTSDTLLKSISSVLNSMNDISTAAEEGAEATTNIAQRTCNVVTKSSDVSTSSKATEQIADELRDSVAKFRV